MTKTAYGVLLASAVAGAFLGGSWYGQWGAATPANRGDRNIRHRAVPINASHVPGTAGVTPAAAMPSDAVHAHAGPADSARTSAAVPPGIVHASPEQQQLIGVRVSPVEKASGAHTLRLFGRVAPDETRVHKINAGIDGSIRGVSAVTTGSQVKKDQLLATYSAPGALSTIQLFILNSGTLDRAKLGPSEGQNALALAGANLRQRLDQLHNIGMSTQQMEEIAQTKLFPESIRILAPADGFVLARNVSPGQRFERGAEFFRIADLSRVWIQATVFENEARYLRPGRTLTASLPHERRIFQAKVSAVLPQSDPATATVKVRLEVENPGYILRPEMFVDVELPVTLPPAIAVPVDAVIDSGLRRTVFVQRGEGVFEPRQVETGWRFGDRVEIVSGLTPGERIVVSGTFLLDSESRMKPAAERVPGAAGKGKAAGAGDEHGHGHDGH